MAELTPDLGAAAPRALLIALAQHRAQIQRHLLAMVHDPDLAEDLTQETYGRAIDRLAGLRDPQAGLAWLYRIATNVALDRVRRHSPPSVVLDEASVGELEAIAVREPAGSQLEAALERSEMSECVQAYLVSLPDDYRVAILLHDAHGLSNPEIADLVGCSLATVKIRVHRARARLRAALADACHLGLDQRGVLVCEQVSIDERGEGSRDAGPTPSAPASDARR